MDNLPARNRRRETGPPETGPEKGGMAKPDMP